MVLNVIVGVVVDSMDEIKNIDKNKINTQAVNSDADNSDLMTELNNLEKQIEHIKSMISDNNK